jgi:hypothetical protein
VFICHGRVVKTSIHKAMLVANTCKFKLTIAESETTMIIQKSPMENQI